ncbi:unnamed protein product [Cochlearia groenlandica]
MSCSVKSGFVTVLYIILLLLSSNVGCAGARSLRFHKHHHHHHKAASSLKEAVYGAKERRMLGGGETKEEVVVMDYPQPHRKPPIHNEKA